MVNENIKEKSTKENKFNGLINGKKNEYIQLSLSLINKFAISLICLVYKN